jgi:hypothetical protein
MLLQRLDLDIEGLGDVYPRIGLVRAMDV